MNLKLLQLRSVSILMTAYGLIGPSPSFASDALDYSLAKQQILRVANQNDVVFFGEQHKLRGARRLLMLVLEQGFESKLIDGFSTEYVLGENEADFQAFLRDETATPGSASESSFFAKLAATGYVWMNEELNKDLFRLLRRQKIRNPALKICGLDVRSSQDKLEREKRFNSFPPQLLRAAENVFATDVKGMVDDVDRDCDREPMMAIRAAECILGAKKSIIHVGSFHAWSLRFDPKQHNADNKWAATSHFLHVLMPKAKMVAIRTAQAVGKPGKALSDKINVAFNNAHLLFHSQNISKISLLPTYTANSAIKNVLSMKFEDGKLQPIWPVWDYLVLGPEGEYAPLWD